MRAANGGLMPSEFDAGAWQGVASGGIEGDEGFGPVDDVAEASAERGFYATAGSPVTFVEMRSAAGRGLRGAIEGALAEERAERFTEYEVEAPVRTASEPPVMKARTDELVHCIEHLCGRVSIDDPERGFLLRRFKDWNHCDWEAWKILRAFIGLRTEPGQYPRG